MLGHTTQQGTVQGCKVEDGELLVLVSQADGEPGHWMPAAEIRPPRPLAQLYRGCQLNRLEQAREAQAEI